jgi:hypothetical protein
MASPLGGLSAGSHMAGRAFHMPIASLYYDPPKIGCRPPIEILCRELSSNGGRWRYGLDGRRRDFRMLLIKFQSPLPVFGDSSCAENIDHEFWSNSARWLNGNIGQPYCNNIV